MFWVVLLSVPDFDCEGVWISTEGFADDRHNGRTMTVNEERELERSID
jgi:hypothetical protein